MAKYADDALGVAFELPDVISVRQLLKFRSHVAFTQGMDYERYWAGAIQLVTAWECEYAPDPAAVDLDAVDDPALIEKLVDLIQFVCNQTVLHMMEIRSVPKNS